MRLVPGGLSRCCARTALKEAFSQPSCMVKFGNFSLEKGNLHGSWGLVRLASLWKLQMAYYWRGRMRLGVVVND